MDTDTSNYLVHNIERIFLMSACQMDEFPSLRVIDKEASTTFGGTNLGSVDIAAKTSTHTELAQGGICKQKSSMLDIPFVTIRKPHDFQAFGDTEGCASTMEMQDIKESTAALISDGKLTTPGLKLVVDKLQILDDNLRQMEKVVESNDLLVDLMHHIGTAGADTKLGKLSFYATETGDGIFPQESVDHYNKIENIEQSIAICGYNTQDIACTTEKSLKMGYLDNVTVPLKSKAQDKQDCISQAENDSSLCEKKMEKLEKLEILTKDVKLEQNEKVDLGIENHEEGDTNKSVMDLKSKVSFFDDPSSSGTKNASVDSNQKPTCTTSKFGIWKDRLSQFVPKVPTCQDVESSAESAQNVLAATVCVLLVLCIIDNLSAS